MSLVYHDGTSARFTLAFSNVCFAISAGTVVLDSAAASWVLQASTSNPGLY